MLRGYDGFSFGDVAEAVPTTRTTRAHFEREYRRSRMMQDHAAERTVQA